MVELKNNISDISHELQKNKVSDMLFDKTLFLIEWKYILITNTRLFDCVWTHSPYGPVSDFKDIDDIVGYSDSYNIKKRQVVKFILQKIEKLNRTQYINLVYSVYPMIESETYDIINLIKYSNEYKELLSVEDLQKILNLKIKELTLFEKIKVLLWK